LGLLVFDVGRLLLATSREASIDAIRIRNAMVAELGDPSQTNWRPSAAPSDYKQETLPAPSFFVAIAKKLLPIQLSREPALDMAIRIARHLRATSRHGEPIQANTRQTYEKIVTGQGGYCSDYTQVFTALALAAGLSVREWGFAWEDMANGHAFNEIWVAELNKWVFIDSFVSFYVIDANTAVPMSALEFRNSLLELPGAGKAQVVPIEPSRFGFKSTEKALDWYRRGVPQMFLLLGNSVFSYDNNALIRLVEPLPRSIEMLVAILLSEHPRFLFVPPPSHPEVKTAVDHLQWQLAYFLLKVTAALVLAGGLLRAAWRSVTHRSGRHSASHKRG
jgi:hypothetical protein